MFEPPRPLPQHATQLVYAQTDALPPSMRQHEQDISMRANHSKTTYKLAKVEMNNECLFEVKTRGWCNETAECKVTYIRVA